MYYIYNTAELDSSGLSSDTLTRNYFSEVINRILMLCLKFHYLKEETNRRSMVGRVRKPERFPAVDGIREKRENWYARAYREEVGLESWRNASKRPWNKKNRKGEPCYAYQAPTNYWLRHFSFFSFSTRLEHATAPTVHPCNTRSSHLDQG